MRVTRTSPALCVVLAALCSSCWFDGDLKHDLGTVPDAIGDGWATGTPASVGLSEAVLAGIHRELLREDRNLGTLGFLVVKDGSLVFEAYLRAREDRDHYHHLQSVTKSITSLAFGIEVDEGAVGSLDLSMDTIFPDETEGLDPRKRDITLRHLLTMRSGIDFHNDVFSVEMWVDKPDDPVRYMLAKPQFADPGEKYEYRDVDPQLVGYALDKLSGIRQGELVRDRLFTPMGIDDYYWERGPDGVYLAAHALHLRPRDLAKIGQLLLDRGSWNGQQLVPEEWIEEATSEQVRGTKTTREGELYPYGYYFWIVPGVGFTGWGHGGQFMLVVPAQRMVVVQIALPDTDDLHGADLNEFLELVAPIIEKQPIE